MSFTSGPGFNTRRFILRLDAYDQAALKHFHPRQRHSARVPLIEAEADDSVPTPRPHPNEAQHRPAAHVAPRPHRSHIAGARTIQPVRVRMQETGNIADRKSTRLNSS